MDKNDKHPHFDHEQKDLKNNWDQCKQIHNEHKERIDKIKGRLESPAANDPDDYSLRPQLNRKKRALKTRIAQIESALDKLYFGKIVYTNKKGEQVVYIGKSSLDLNGTIIASYKAPIADIYYSKGSVDNVTVNREKGIDLELVRTLEVEQDRLLATVDDFVKDIGEQKEESDSFLRKQLEKLGEERFCDIYVTIQKEQNEIIRSPVDQHLVIQGGAGTGKTIVLLYRLAYLMHNQKWKPEEVLLLSPSNLFLYFLKNMLPDAEMQEINLYSLYEVNKGLIKKSHERNWLPPMIELEPGFRDIASDSANFKGSNAFKQMVNEKIDALAKAYTRYIKDFTYIVEGKQTIIPASKIRESFLHELSKHPFEKRKKIIRERIKRKLSDVIGEVLSGNRDGEPAFSSQEIESMLGEYFREWPESARVYREFLKWYSSLLDNFKDVGRSLENAQTKVSENARLWNNFFSMFSLNDLAVLLYASQKINDQRRKFKHIVIDEAQFLTPVWLEALTTFLEENGTMTLTGDLNQKPEMVDIYDWKDLSCIIGEINVRELSVSYRLTDEVAKMSLDLLGSYDKSGKLYKYDFAGRSGQPIQELSGSLKERLTQLAELVSSHDNYKTFAIITRTSKDAEMVYETINSLLDTVTIARRFDDKLGQITVIPVSLVSGMEFDFTAIVNYRDYDTKDTHEARALYIAVTRAVHKLVLS